MNLLETYLKELSEIRSSGAAVKETSYYGPLANLLNEIGKTLKPKVKCIIMLQMGPDPCDVGPRCWTSKNFGIRGIRVKQVCALGPPARLRRAGALA